MRKKDNNERTTLLQPDKLSWAFIQNKAEEFRRKYVDPIDLVPVPILDIVEFRLKIQVIPEANLKSKIEIDGFLTKDLEHICIDLDIYMNDRNRNRLNFTFAHEVGHFVLHKNLIRQCNFRTTEEWIHFHEDFLEDDLNWFESQASEFAGSLLVPKKKLFEELKKQKDKIIQFQSMTKSTEAERIKEIVSREICKVFRVSHYVIQKRIRKERIWEELNL